MGHPEEDSLDERPSFSLDELISLGKNFLRPEYPSTWTEADQYRNGARLWLIEHLGDNAGLLARFESACIRGFDRCAYSKDGVTVEKPLDLDDPDKMLAPVIAGVAETIQVLREASLKVKLQPALEKTETGVLKISAPPPINHGTSKTEEPHRAFESWDKIKISFLSEERVQIFDGANNPTYNYAELGFADRRTGKGSTGKPNRAWKTLAALAQQGGILKDGASTRQHWPSARRWPRFGVVILLGIPTKKATRRSPLILPQLID